MPYLAFNLNDGNEFVFDILEERLSIGRDAKNDIVIDNTYISGFHAEFIRQADGVYELVDLKSSNGIFVNGKRIDRIRVKGGDKIRFGQLDSRFRERPPKGTAPSTEAKNVVAKGQPVRTDGKRGDTESVPAKDGAPKSETSPVEPTKTPLARPDMGIKGPSVAAAHGMLIQRTAPADVAQQKQVDELKEEVGRLQKERDLLRRENETETLRREELRALEKQVEEGRKTLAHLETRTVELKSSLTDSEDELAKLAVKRREAANLDSQVESSRSALAKVQDDIAVATKSLQALHVEADKASADRSASLKEKETVAAELALLKQDLSEASVPAAVVVAAVSPEADEATFSARSMELAALDAQVTQRQAELTEVQKTLERLRQEEDQRTAQVQTLVAKETSLTQTTGVLAELENKRSLLDAALAGLTGNQTALETKLADLEKQCAEASARLRDVSSDHAKATSEHEALNAAKLKLETHVQDLRQQSEHLISNQKKAEEEASQKLATLEGLLRQKAEELKALETRSGDLTNKLDDLAATDTQLSSASEALKAVEAHKGELTATISQLSQERDALTRELLAATEKGKAQHGLTQTLMMRRESLEKEVRGIEEQKEMLTADVAKARESLRQAETALDERQQEAKAAEAKTEEFTTKASEVVAQHAALQKEITSLRAEAQAARMELDKVTGEAAAQKQ
ncbi:MAG TPA: hypothetical protein DCP71_06205, partial [Verrucomicrobiales bacterium]|nr:hypothetical protein [Verrucomicrobiales bacterium]